MTDPKDEAPEQSLASLFERTARTLPDEDRARLGRRARDVGSFPRRALPKFGLVWAPALAAAAAVAYLAIPMRHVAPASDAHSAVASATAATQAIAPYASAATPSAPTEDTTEADDDAFAVLTGDPSDVEPLDLGPLMMAGEPLEHHHAGSHARALPERQSERSEQ